MNLLCCYHPWPKQVSHLYKEAFESVKDCDCSSSRFLRRKGLVGRRPLESASANRNLIDFSVAHEIHQSDSTLTVAQTHIGGEYFLLAQ